MKKKDHLSKEDKEDWEKFLEDTSSIPNKDQSQPEDKKNKKFKFDLHGLTLDEANNKVKEIILSCSKRSIREILLITGKGLHSTQDDVYKSSQFSKLRYSVPEFINSEPEISKLVLSINTSSKKDGGEGALVVKLRRL